MQRPLVVVYRVSLVTYWVGRMLLKVAHVALVNLLAGRRLVPELLQGEMTPERIAGEVRRCGGRARRASRCCRGSRRCAATLGAEGAARRAAEAVLELLPPRSGAARIARPRGPLLLCPGAMNPALVCIPTYNERENLEPIVAAVLAAEPRVDILVVDDNSPDGTGAARRRARRGRAARPGAAPREEAGAGARLPARVPLGAGGALHLRHRDGRGLQPRSRATCRRSSTPPMGGADLVLGSRYVEGGGTVNWGVGAQDHQPRRLALRAHHPGRARARPHRRLQVLPPAGAGGARPGRACRAAATAFQIELTYRALRKGFRVKEIPIVFEDRRVGQSKMSRKIFLEALTDGLEAAPDGVSAHDRVLSLFLVSLSGGVLRRGPDRRGAAVPRDDGERLAREGAAHGARGPASWPAG